MIKIALLVSFKHCPELTFGLFIFILRFVLRPLLLLMLMPFMVHMAMVDISAILVILATLDILVMLDMLAMLPLSTMLGMLPLSTMLAMESQMLPTL